MAAAVQDLGPQTDLQRANTVQVVAQVLRWRGSSEEDSRAGWDDLDEHSGKTDVYEALIRMAHQKHREGPGRPPTCEGRGAFIRGRGQLGRSRRPESSRMLAVLQFMPTYRARRARCRRTTFSTSRVPRPARHRVTPSHTHRAFFAPVVHTCAVECLNRQSSLRARRRRAVSALTIVAAVCLSLVLALVIASLMYLFSGSKGPPNPP